LLLSFFSRYKLQNEEPINNKKLKYGNRSYMLVSLKKRSYVIFIFLGTLKMLPIQIKHFE